MAPGNAVVIETDSVGSTPENLKPVPRQPGLEGRSTETNLIPVLTETCPLGFSKSHVLVSSVPRECWQNSPEPYEGGQKVPPQMDWGLQKSIELCIWKD